MDERGCLSVREFGREKPILRIKDIFDLRECAFSPDGQWFAVRDGHVLALYDLTTKQKIRRVFGIEKLKFCFQSNPSLGILLAEISTIQEEVSLRRPCHQLIELRTGRTIGNCPWGAQWAISGDGRILAIAERDVKLYEVATGMELGTLACAQGNISELVFSPDSQTLTTRGEDTTVLVWDWAKACSPLRDRPASPEKAWLQLADPDAPKSNAAQVALASGKSESMALLRENLKPFTKDDFQQAAELIRKLENNRFPVRRRAMDELRQYGRGLQNLLAATLKRNVPPETENRLRMILDSIENGDLSSDELRQLRSIAVLERMNTPESRALLKELARGEPAALRTTEAKAALARMR